MTTCIPENSGDNLVFLLGLPRSGTTLLAEILGNDESILAPPEPWLMFAALEIGRVDLRHPAGMQSVGHAVAQFMDADMRRQAQHRFAFDAYNTWLTRSKKALFLDKTPRYYQIAGEIAALFPAARFILLRRNPVDIALSYHQSWSIDIRTLLEKGADDSALFDLLLGPNMLDDFAAQHGDRVHSLSYEDLVENPDAAIAKTMAFLGLERSVSSLAILTQLRHPLRRASDMGDRKILETAAVHRNSRHAWKALPPAELADWVSILGSEIFKRWGYGDVLAALGTAVPQPDRNRGLQQQVAALYTSRLADMKRTAQLTNPLSADEQTDIAYILSPESEYVASGQRGRLSTLTTRFAELQRQLVEEGTKLASMDHQFQDRGDQIETLTRQLREAELDRTARGKQIEILTRQLREVELDRTARGEQIEALTRQLREAELDRTARGEQIEALTRQLREAELDRTARGEQTEALTRLLREAALDRTARGEQTEALARLLHTAGVDQTARDLQIQTLTVQLQAAESDCAARGNNIEILTKQLLESEADRAARFEQIGKLTAWLREAQAAKEELQERLDSMIASNTLPPGQKT
jgi:hypothetical protein